MSITERDPQTGLKPGAELAGRYRLERVLGEGGMGVVWEARQITTDKPVAVKVLKGSEGEGAARFLREARVAASLQHRHIVQVFDFWEVDGGGPVFMVMELLRGETLAALLARVGRLTFSDALAVLVPVAQALRAAHDQGVVHRDLKPENVFLARLGGEGSFDVKVLDFGLAKPMASTSQSTALTQTGSVMGTPFYMAPEQVYGEKDIDARADIWAFGVLVYELLTGGRPFTGENYGQVFRQISSGTFRPMRDVLADVPPALDALVANMLQHDRAARPQSLGDVERDLVRIAQSEAPGAALVTTQLATFATVRLGSQTPPRGPGPVPLRGEGALTPNGTEVVPAHTPPPPPLAPAEPPNATMLGAATSIHAPPARPSQMKLLVVGAAILLVLGMSVGTFILFAAFKPIKPTQMPNVGTVLTMPVPTPSGAPPAGPSAAALTSASAAEPATSAAPSASAVTAEVAPKSPPAAGPAGSAPLRAREKPSTRSPTRDPLSGGRF